MNRSLLSLLWALAPGTTLYAQEKQVTAAQFATNGMLDEAAYRLFVVHRMKVGVQDLMNPRSLSIDQAKLRSQTDDWLAVITTRVQHGPPFSAAEADAVLPVEPKPERPAWQKIDGFTKEYVHKFEDPNRSATLGAIKIRRDLAEATKEAKDAKGAKFSFVDNHQSGENGAWNSQGAIYYPMSTEFPIWNDSGSVLLAVGLAGEWNVAEREAPKTKITDPGDVEDLTLSVPFSFFINPPAKKRPVFGPDNQIIDLPGGPSSSQFILQAKPYLNTDFSFDHEIFGVTASASYVGSLFGGPVFIGKFQNFSDAPAGSSWVVDSNLRYQLTLSPLIDYSDVRQAGTHTTRKPGDDWTRVGAHIGFDVAFGATSTPFVLGTSYKFLDTIDGNGGYSYLWKSNATWWVTENVGISLEHQIGNTPVSDKEIDQTTLGLEFKY